MNKYQRKNRPNTDELVVPFGAEDGLEPLYDDCPICQELKRDLEVRKVRRPIVNNKEAVPLGR